MLALENRVDFLLHLHDGEEVADHEDLGHVGVQRVDLEAHDGARRLG